MIVSGLHTAQDAAETRTRVGWHGCVEIEETGGIPAAYCLLFPEWELGEHMWGAGWVRG